MAARTRKTTADAPYPPGWEPFLAAICAEMQDDTPRLVFADWLDESGDPERAELIRLQCQLARSRAADPANGPAHTREKELVDGNWGHWTRGFPGWLRADRFSHPFIRGFIAELGTTGARWAADGPTIVRLTPVEALSLYRTSVEALRSPALSNVGGLCIEQIDSTRVRVLADHPDLSAIRRLRLGTGQDGRIRAPAHISSDAVRLLLGNPTLTGLRELELRETGHGNTVARSLAAAPFRSLERLSLYRSGVTPEAFEELVRSSSAASLRGLYLAGNPLRDDGVRHLVESPVVSGLDNLNLSDCGLTPRSAELLAAWPGLRSVRWMVLDYNFLGEREEAIIRSSPHAQCLADFRIRFTRPS